uniref:Uncharacterized protein n=1 Tax=Arundo donax TaxID=35708 RepID=A0A0A9H1Y3_ARUDO
MGATNVWNELFSVSLICVNFTKVLKLS